MRKLEVPRWLQLPQVMSEVDMVMREEGRVRLLAVLNSCHAKIQGPLVVSFFNLVLVSFFEVQNSLLMHKSTRCDLLLRKCANF